MATTCFLLDPAINPGIEAQAAARIYRLGQSKPTRVVRLLAEDTIEQRVLRLQQHKAQSSRRLSHQASGGAGVPPPAAAASGGEVEGGGAVGDEGILVQDLDGGTVLRFFDDL